MNKILYFLMAGLFFTTFQVLEVEAQRGDPDRGDGGRATDRELDARYGTDRDAPVDTRVAAPSEDTRGGGLSKSEMIQECKKTYGKKKKNKAAKQACIAAAKGK